MWSKTSLSASALAAVILAAGGAVAVRPATTPDALHRNTEPGGTPADAQLAQSNPSEYAWQLFYFLNRQAAPGKPGQPDPTKPTLNDNDPGAAVVWETWALANQNDNSEVFSCPPRPPVPWEKLPRDQPVDKLATLSANLTALPNLPNIASLPAQTSDNTAVAVTDTMAAFPLPPRPQRENNQEVRMNQSTYETIRQQGLWSQKGILASVRKAQSAHQDSFVTFHPDAKTIKAKWIPIQETDKPRYHWRTSTASDGTLTIWGLAALHIMTRDLANWFWVDFTHADCLVPQAPCIGIAADQGAAQPAPGIVMQRPEISSSKWGNYRLLGTETGYLVRNAQTPQILADPLIEDGVKSSCITCHAYASTAAKAVPTGLGGPQLARPNALKHTQAGLPDNLFCGQATCTATTPRVLYQSSFSWSMILNAKPEHGGCQNP